MWFKELMGFSEENPKQVRANIKIVNNKMISKVNHKEYIYGRLEITSLEKLQKEYKLPDTNNSKLSVSEVIGDVKTFHKNKENNGALFQVASQFNLLEMVSPFVTPERGVGIYEGDCTQGPACAIACGAGTIYRNYFVPVKDHVGQTENNQINCMEDMEKTLWLDNIPLWQIQNGYLFTSPENLQKINDQIIKKTTVEYKNLKAKLKIGIQWGTEVTLNATDNIVTQVFCTALPVNYNPDKWEIFARLILEATYEATFYIALQNFEKTGNNKVFLTLVGSRVFGNKKEWILGAIKMSIIKFSKTPLDIKIVSYLKPDLTIKLWIEELKSSNII